MTVTAQPIDTSTVPTRKAITATEAAKTLGLSTNTLYALIHENRLRHIKVGRKILIPTTAVDEFLAGSK